VHLDADLVPAALGVRRVVADQVAVPQRHGDRLDRLLEPVAAGEIVARRVVLQPLHDLRAPAGVVGELDERLVVEPPATLGPAAPAVPPAPAAGTIAARSAGKAAASTSASAGARPAAAPGAARPAGPRRPPAARPVHRRRGEDAVEQAAAVE